MVPSMEMSERSIEEYTEKMRGRYARMTGRKARGIMLDEFVTITGWDRKHANKVLLGKRWRKGRRGKRGAPTRYPDGNTTSRLDPRSANEASGRGSFRLIR